MTSYIQKVNAEMCDYILTLKRDEFFKLFPRKQHKQDDSDIYGLTYYNKVIQTLRAFKQKGYSLQIGYSYSIINPDKGRLFTNIGLQNIDKEVRSALTQGIYHDYDMKNAHPNILLQMCKENNIISCEYLKLYCSNRAEFLEDNNISKSEILKILNQDKPKKSKYSTEVQNFINQINDIKKKLYPLIKDKYNIKPDSKNPMSSCFNNHWCHLENQLLQDALKKCDPSKIGVLMFDGCLLYTSDAADE